MNNAEKQTDRESRFPIRELSARTQVNTVTLRAWERRYGLLKPERTDKGHRLYSLEDVATIEKILALVARGVPLGKVKPLLLDELPEETHSSESESWRRLIDEMIAAINTFSTNKLENLFHQAMSSYPTDLCRERLIEPLFTELSQRQDHGAALGFAESELLRYASLRLSTKAAQKKRSASVTLIAGNQAPLWRLTLMALELNDSEFSVMLLNRCFSFDAALQLASGVEPSTSVFYQDGVLNNRESSMVNDALLNNGHLFLCGTAPSLAIAQKHERVYADVKECIRGLISLLDKP